ncbi:MAG: carboxypeptidase-like regulatory domain-containing protein [Acidobacteriia bacterium]|nr:carboxypeptidase-like regulatory domain-containing protein [Terriglobia bacterium]
MKSSLFRLVTAMLLVTLVSLAAYAQGGASSSLAGTVVDQSGGVIPGAEVVIKNNSTGAESKAVTADNGTFFIPALAAGTYTATVSMPNFKQAVVKDIVLSAGAPGSIRVPLQVGGISEVVTVEANAEVVQSQTATITTTMNTTQIASLPLATRSALDFLVFLPGVNTTGSARDSTIAGMPNNTINITIDGINTQDNYLKGSAGGDGFFSMISPRLDAVQEVTLSTATPGSEAAGQGAVQIKFVTRSGNNDYHGSVYEYHQNSALNANNWFTNRDRGQTYDGTQTPCTAAQMQTEFEKCKAPRNFLLLNQWGFRVGGPISLPKALFGPLSFSGKDRAFFFLNYEETRQPWSQNRTRTIFNPLVDQGIFPYTVGQTTQQVNLLNLAAANGQTATWDPTIQKLLADIRNATTQQGTVKQQTDPAYMDYMITNKGFYLRQSPTARFDINLTDKHRIEGTWNFMKYVPDVDTTNSMDPAYPGFPNFGTQGSNRFSGSVTLRSTLTPRLVNEARTGLLGGVTLFSPDVNLGMFQTNGVGNQDGFALSLSLISNVYRQNNPSRRDVPNESFDDALTWTRGSHSFSIGGSFTNVGLWSWGQQIAPGISFGVNSTYDPSYIMFNTQNQGTNFPNASSAQISTAMSMYALMTGRVTQITGTGILSEITNKYTYDGAQVQRGHMRELGFFIADSWRMRPNLTLNYGVRWEGQLPFVPLNNMYTTNTVADLYGVSGYGNMFKPGTIAGVAPTYKLYKAGDPAYNTSYHDFAPSLGFAWSPNAEGFLKKILGENGKSVLRGGFGLAYNRNGMYDYTSMFSANPGMTVNATRSVANGNLVSGAGTDVWPLLFRDKSRLGAPTFADAPLYPIQSTSISDQVNLFDPYSRTPYTMSWSFGLQRELTKDMAVEVRYVATRNEQPWTQRNFNEQNIVENGMLDEFKLAMANLKANQAYNVKNTFAYTGAPGTSPLPITLAYLSGFNATQAMDPAKYTSSSFTSSTYVNTLAQFNPNPGSYATSLWNNATQRANALAAGLPANFFFVNPTVASGGAWLSTNGGFNRYDSMVVELRRRLSRGLLVQANYVFAKGLSGSFLSFRAPRATVTGATLPQAFKINWVYELPIGSGRTLLGEAHGVVDRLIGGWEFQGTGRWQSGNLINVGNVRLVGMTLSDLQDAVGLRFDDQNRQVYYVPADILSNTIKAYNVSATTSTGYSTSVGVPTGRYIAPANSGGCIQVVSGDCTGLTNYVRGPRFQNFDMSLVKRIRFTESKNFELRAEFLNAFNNTNFNGSVYTGTSATGGQLSGTQNGPRVIQAVLRLNF